MYNKYELYFSINMNFFGLLDSQINVFLDTKAKTSGITEVSPQQLVFLDFQPAF